MTKPLAIDENQMKQRKVNKESGVLINILLLTCNFRVTSMLSHGKFNNSVNQKWLIFQLKYNYFRMRPIFLQFRRNITHTIPTPSEREIDSGRRNKNATDEITCSVCFARFTCRFSSPEQIVSLFYYLFLILKRRRNKLSRDEPYFRPIFLSILIWYIKRLVT